MQVFQTALVYLGWSHLNPSNVPPTVCISVMLGILTACHSKAKQPSGRWVRTNNSSNMVKSYIFRPCSSYKMVFMQLGFWSIFILQLHPPMISSSLTIFISSKSMSSSPPHSRHNQRRCNNPPKPQSNPRRRKRHHG